ncbi:MAG: adenosylcobinamide-GDP ribazoletransferase [Gemmiger formicilis]|uniref:adenosylcobinamide-GDP ribazoletransferase n=1 Tax=Gemmiger formicilis TaxID=745368 RepID=UPI003A1EA36A
MTALQTIAVAFAMFSALPMPQFDWNEKNMRYALCAFPLVGAVCGALWCVCGVLPLPAAARAAGFCLVPVWVTGGIHLDGYADTCDALSSYGDTAKKLEILKDPHCGAFAVIRLCSYFAAYFALCGCVAFTPRVGVLWTLALVGSGRCPGWPWRRSRWRKTPALPTPLPRRRTASACGRCWPCSAPCWPWG